MKTDMNLLIIKQKKIQIILFYSNTLYYITWWVTVSSDLSDRMFIWSDGSLEIVSVTKADEGLYTCFAENDHGKANSSGTLIIKGQWLCSYSCIYYAFRLHEITRNLRYFKT